MAGLFGGYKSQVYHEVAQRIAQAIKGRISADNYAVSVPEEEDSKVTEALLGVPGLTAFLIVEPDEQQYLRHVVVKRPNRNAVRFAVMRQTQGQHQSYVVRAAAS